MQWVTMFQGCVEVIVVFCRDTLVRRELKARVVQWDYKALSVPLDMKGRLGSKVKRSVLSDLCPQLFT